MLQATLKDQVSHLSDSERRELVSYVVALETNQDDQTPGNWIELNELRRRTAW